MVRRLLQASALSASILGCAAAFSAQPMPAEEGRGTPTLEAVLEAPAPQYDVPWSQVPANALYAAVVFGNWTDADTHLKSTNLVAHTYPMENLINDPHGWGFCNQMTATPHLSCDEDNCLVTTYGTNNRPDLSQGDSIMVMDLDTATRTFKRYKDAVLVFPPDPDNYWPHQGGMGVGMSIISLPTPTSAGYKYLGVLGIDNRRDNQEFYALAGSPDGHDWYMQGKNGVPTKDPFAAEPFVATENLSSGRHYHQVLYYDQVENKAYLFFGENTANGTWTYLSRFTVDTTQPFGKPPGATPLELWDNGVNAKGYEPTKGSFIPFSGRLNDIQSWNGIRHGVAWTMAQPMSITPLHNIDGTPQGLLMLYNSYQAYSHTGQVNFRFTKNQSWPFEWGPEGRIDLTELWSAGLIPCTAGETGTAIYQRGDKLFALVSAAQRSCNPARDVPRIGTCAGQRGGLAMVQIYNQPSGKSGLQPNLEFNEPTP